MIVISTDTVAVCIGTKRDRQSQIFVSVTKSFFCVDGTFHHHRQCWSTCLRFTQGQLSGLQGTISSYYFEYLSRPNLSNSSIQVQIRQVNQKLWANLPTSWTRVKQGVRVTKRRGRRVEGGCARHGLLEPLWSIDDANDETSTRLRSKCWRLTRVTHCPPRRLVAETRRGTCGWRCNGVKHRFPPSFQPSFQPTPPNFSWTPKWQPPISRWEDIYSLSSEPRGVGGTCNYGDWNSGIRFYVDLVGLHCKTWCTVLMLAFIAVFSFGYSTNWMHSIAPKTASDNP